MVVCEGVGRASRHLCCTVIIEPDFLQSALRQIRIAGWCAILLIGCGAVVEVSIVILDEEGMRGASKS